jgi:putative DNA primase/helicase
VKPLADELRELDAAFAAREPGWKPPVEHRARSGASGASPAAASSEADLRTLLADLGDLEYEQQRDELAGRFGLRVSVLDRMHREERGAGRRKREGGLTLREFAPWPDAVDGADTLDELMRAIRRFIIIDEAPLVAVVLWIMAAHALDAFAVFAILLISAATKGCGKSTLLDVVARVVPRPLLSAGSTAAALYRSAAQAPVVLVDEGDRYLSEDRRLGVFFCAGHRRGVPFRLCEGDDNRVVEYPSWCAKVLAQIGKPHDAAILDRCIVVELRRKLSGETAAPFSALAPYPELDELGRRCARWAADHLDEIREAQVELPAGFGNRVADNWTPLLRVAEVAGGTWPERARLAATAIGAVEDEGLEVLLLRDLRDLFRGEWLFDGRVPCDSIYTEMLVTELCRVTERPWCRIRKGKALDGAWLARKLGPFGIRADRILNGGDRRRGYRREQLEDVWARYLPPPSAPEPSSPSTCPNAAATGGWDGTGHEGAPQPVQPQAAGNADGGHLDGTDKPDEQSEGYIEPSGPDDDSLGGVF